MDLNELESRIRDLLAEVIESDDFDKNTFDYEENLFLHGLDSMSAVALVALLEEEFSFEFPDDDLSADNLQSIERIVSYVSDKLQ